MARPKNVVRPSLLHLSLPEDVRAKLDDHLGVKAGFEPPRGIYQRFFVYLINREIDRHEKWVSEQLKDLK